MQSHLKRAMAHAYKSPLSLKRHLRQWPTHKKPALVIDSFPYSLFISSHKILDKLPQNEFTCHYFSTYMLYYKYIHFKLEQFKVFVLSIFSGIIKPLNANTNFVHERYIIFVFIAFFPYKNTNPKSSDWCK